MDPLGSNVPLLDPLGSNVPLLDPLGSNVRLLDSLGSNVPLNPLESPWIPLDVSLRLSQVYVVTSIPELDVDFIAYWIQSF